MDDSVWWLLRDTRRVMRRGAASIEQRQRARLRDMVAFARAYSPFYRELYRQVPPGVDDPTLLPATTKGQLMAEFDAWGTDRAVTREAVDAFVDNPALIGERFLDRYTVATTSGTTGTRGVFLIDDAALRVTNVLAARVVGAWLRPRDLPRILARRARMTMVNAAGGHFASTVAAVRLQRRRGNRVQVLPVTTPLPDLVDALNRFQPALLASYASTAALLASEQAAGRLHINPVLTMLSAEGLPLSEYDRIARTLRTTVANSYAATECPFLSYSCQHGWLHVNADWVVVEPVDVNHRPTPPGQPSHTVLISNLANRIQPILRYDLGDSVLQRPDPCPCGNPLPALRVQGRAADLLTFPTAHGGTVAIAPLAFATTLEPIPGIDLYQIAQTTPTTLRVRLRPAADADPDQLWRTVHAAITRLLATHDLSHVSTERGGEPPQASPGGKYPTIIPLH
ncbi:phenylacetate--CoA ligase family protein [Micromonospora aurantiaca]|jgi:phenylacetate-coenzyme A ligase PaaK-like adenylate-forming protein|uniref:Phenylacetate--CoA ligase family protein n=2 Tax=Micromonospora aurantiaca (nom. illeg.) TaxID=47850 RepID=A0A3M9JZK4_9ACTN|nr:MULTISPECIES: hypothetical protein [Micromonospora]ADU09708.1 coenzyme F390 synthetase [Micromonospora sp. L5]AXH93668.1 phenylacetate--CoA ligase family protein [Micromonospora aurantiaca]KAB1108433.1 phenylacetate--CoA ligase family protein [Micromonospora aurantiaca]MDG4752845.1 phenylacetate--CoA ligase family protein [Micromonospora sp. WMMD718]RNH94099.1 phenylacetate--CoA ligase family protein [Micromonospora aurantiaca]